MTLPFIASMAEVGGGLVSAWSASRENRKMRDWQTHMSNTAYQRSVQDMRAAGLNPMLMMGSGGAASTPSPSLAGVPGEAVAEGISKGVSSARSWSRVKDELRLLKQEVQNADRTGDLINSQIRKADSEADIAGEEYKRLLADSVLWMSRRNDAEIRSLEANSANALANAGFTSAKGKWITPTAIGGIIRDVLGTIIPWARLGRAGKVLRRVPGNSRLGGYSTTRRIP